jgi:hypothetical protein
MSILSALNNPAALQAVAQGDMAAQQREALAHRARRERIMNIASILGEQDPAVQDGMMPVRPANIQYGTLGPAMASSYSHAGGYR